MRSLDRLPTRSLLVLSFFFVLTACLSPLPSTPPSSETFLAMRQPKQEWTPVPLPADSLAQPSSPRLESKFGGDLSTQETATGYFRTQKTNDRWTLIDPEGHWFISKGLVSVAVQRTHNKELEVKRQGVFASKKAWAIHTLKFMRENGFNTLGAWSDLDALNTPDSSMPYTVNLNIMGAFGSHLKVTRPVPGHLAFPSDIIPVFDERFPTFAQQHIKDMVEKHVGNPYLLGYFSDNELPFPSRLLDACLQQNSDNSCKIAAQNWISENGINQEKITDSERREFLTVAIDKYMSITTGILKRLDPHHLFLGPRLHQPDARKKSIFRALGKYADIISFNYYTPLFPDPGQLREWSEWSQRPILISEFYTKGADSGFSNETGAGWIVPTQKDRGVFYERFAGELLKSKVCVGWHWLKYMDNDPSVADAEPSNRDSNKGVVRLDYAPYTPLVETMERTNSRVYSTLHSH